METVKTQTWLLWIKSAMILAKQTLISDAHRIQKVYY